MNKTIKKEKNKYMKRIGDDNCKKQVANKKEGKMTTVKIIILGIFTGFLSGLFASGGGLIAVPGLVYFLHTGEKEARAIALFSILPMTLTSMIFYKIAGETNWKLGILCGIGGLVGGVIGANLLKRIKDKYLVLIFIIFLIYASILIFNK